MSNDIVLIESESDSEDSMPIKNSFNKRVLGTQLIPVPKKFLTKPFAGYSDENDSKDDANTSKGSLLAGEEESIGGKHNVLSLSSGFDIGAAEDQDAQEYSDYNGFEEMDEKPKEESTDDSDAGLIPNPNAIQQVSSSSEVSSSSSDEDVGFISVRKIDGDMTKLMIYDARSFLKEQGPVEFVKTYLPKMARFEDVLKAIEVLGYKIDQRYVSNPTLDYFIEVLRLCIQKCLKERIRLPDFNTEEQLLKKIQESNKILIITGAGISTSLGIPDFRSSKGFYSRLTSLGLSDPQEVFDLEYFRTDPSIFYSIAHMILPPADSFTPLHAFIKLLDQKNKLLRNYTQNIDNLEENVKINPDRIVQCHGSFATATCMTCKFKVPLSFIRKDIVNKVVSYCPKCIKKRKNLEKNDAYFEECYGVFKPDITFFQEKLPERFHDLIRQDLLDCDLLISVGTSLEVAPVADIVKKIPGNVPQVLINKNPIPHNAFDVSILGACDDAASYLCEKLGWQLDHKDFETILGEDNLSLHTLNPYEGLYSIINKQNVEEK